MAGVLLRIAVMALAWSWALATDFSKPSAVVLTITALVVIVLEIQYLRGLIHKED